MESYDAAEWNDGAESACGNTEVSRHFPILETWQFKIGQCVSHKDQSMPSLVMGRVKTSKGREVYGVRSFAEVDPCRDRMILGDSLVNVIKGSEPCQTCLLFRTSLCPNG
jgi:hypothetical protein